MLTRHQAPGCGGGSTVDAAEGVCDALTPVDTAAAAAHTHAQREPACCHVARGPSSRLQAAVGAALLTLLREAVTHTHPLTLPLLLHAHTRNGSLHAAKLLGGPSSRLQAAVGAVLLTLLREFVTHSHPLALPLLLHTHTRNGSLHAAILLGDQAAGSRLRWGQQC